MREDCVMNRLFFESIPLDSLIHFDNVLKLYPFIGLHRVKFSEFIEIDFKYLPIYFNKTTSELVDNAFYIIYYPRFFKIGSSRVNWITSRVFSQAPLIGIISFVVEVNPNVDLNYVEKNFAKYVRGILGINISSARSSENCFEDIFEKYIYYLLENNVDLNELSLISKNLMNLSKLLYEYVSREYDNELTIIYKPFNYVIRTKLSQVDIDILEQVLRSRDSVKYNISILREKCWKNLCSGELVILQNGLCIVEYRNSFLIVSCDRIQYNLLLKLKR